GEQNIVQAQSVEAVVQHQDGGLGSVSLPPAVFFADEDAELSRAGAMVDVVQPRAADRTHGRSLVDGEDDVLLALAGPLVPCLFRLPGRGAEADGEGASDLEIVDPALVERQQLAAMRPEGYLVARDVDDRPIMQRG